MVSDDGFDPNDLSDLESAFTRITHDSSVGYTIEFIMTKLAARDMVETWLNALMGDRDAIRTCMANYSYIVEEVMHALQQDD